MKRWCQSFFKVTFAVTFIVTLCWCTLAAGAFSRAAAQEFFPKNYVQEQASPKAPESPTQQASPHKAEHSKPLAGVIPLQEKIQALVYVNSANKEHFDRVVAKVLAVQKQRKIHIYALMHLGDYRNVDPKQQQDLTNAGIVVTSLTQLPEKLPATQSPVWGLMTPESRTQQLAYVIEGYMEPELFFNQAGQFEIPAGMQVGKDTQEEGRLTAF
jgi:hypothetical protein